MIVHANKRVATFHLNGDYSMLLGRKRQASYD